MKSELSSLKAKSSATVTPEPPYLTIPKAPGQRSDSSTSVNGVILSPLSPRGINKLVLRGGILCRDDGDTKRGRKDRKGITIDRGKRIHHIMFRDELAGKKIADVKEVESYKSYNLLIEESTTGCSCVLL